jgi:hypothetical protein
MPYRLQNPFSCWITLLTVSTQEFSRPSHLLITCHFERSKMVRGADLRAESSPKGILRAEQGRCTLRSRLRRIHFFAKAPRSGLFPS